MTQYLWSLINQPLNQPEKYLSEIWKPINGTAVLTIL